MSVADSEEVRSGTPSDDLNAPILDVRCGQMVARLHMDKFVCPGIHQLCIELNGEFISPKELTLRASKDKQKDWKGSIRLAKTNLRVLMETKKLDFYNHDAYCSGKCQGRNYLGSRSCTMDGMNQTAYDSASTSGGLDIAETVNYSPTMVTSMLQQFVAQTVGSASAFPAYNMVGTDPSILSSFLNSNERYNGKLEKTENALERDRFSARNVAKAMKNNPVKFWSVMNELGLLDSILRIVSGSVEKTLRMLNVPPQQSLVAERLSRMAQILNLEGPIGDRIVQERSKCIAETNLRNSALRESERKTEENRRKFEEARRKAVRFEEFLADFQVHSVPPAKKKRLSAADEPSTGTL